MLTISTSIYLPDVRCAIIRYAHADFIMYAMTPTSVTLQSCSFIFSENLAVHGLVACTRISSSITFSSLLLDYSRLMVLFECVSGATFRHQLIWRSLNRHLGRLLVDSNQQSHQQQKSNTLSTLSSAQSPSRSSSPWPSPFNAGRLTCVVD